VALTLMLISSSWLRFGTSLSSTIQEAKAMLMSQQNQRIISFTTGSIIAMTWVWEEHHHDNLLNIQMIIHEAYHYENASQILTADRYRIPDTNLHTSMQYVCFMALPLVLYQQIQFLHTPWPCLRITKLTDSFYLIRWTLNNLSTIPSICRNQK
jgi:hypothetical protein